MNFGDWEMFKVIIVSLREQELTNVMKQDEAKNVRFSVVRPQQVSIGQDKRGTVHLYPVSIFLINVVL